MPAAPGRLRRRLEVRRVHVLGHDRHRRVEPPRLLRRHDAAAVEVLDLGRDAHGKLARVERADPVDPAAPGDGRLPGGARVVPERRDRSQPRDDDSFLHVRNAS